MNTSYQIIELDDDIAEPVTLAEQKAYSQIDEDYSVKDDQILMFISAARLFLESQINVGLVKRSVRIEWNGLPMELPLGPTGTIDSVKDKDGESLDPSKYFVSPYSFKTISVKGIGLTDCDWFYVNTGYVEPFSGCSDCVDQNDMYSCEYETGYESIRSDLKTAIMAQADFMLKQLGMPDSSGEQISPVALMLVKPYSRNLNLQ